MMKPDAIKRVLYGLTLTFVGLFGVALIAFFFLAMAGMTTLVSRFAGVLFYGAALAGPLMLVGGGALLAVNFKVRTASATALAGAALVSLWVLGIIGSAILGAMHPSANPAIDSAIHPQDAVIYGILAGAAALVDWASYRALRCFR